ncbi:uncharacterized protein Dwil_GK27562 [Drosophila willistoni]|uniref:Uncharacterized protein n=1 Tax=Drosophila willistoni TaxID=7260 RepID=A0A0Q9WP91_DROWI|nr:beclin-1-like protein A [Drosophila willistoni]KRF97535.1 uncharacterized protein Dwil_GK27562 [Drosophila willistoni]
MKYFAIFGFFLLVLAVATASANAQVPQFGRNGAAAASGFLRQKSAGNHPQGQPPTPPPNGQNDGNNNNNNNNGQNGQN